MEESLEVTFQNNHEQQLIKALNDTALVSIMDPKGLIIYANDKFCKTSGYSQQELIGQSHQILYSEKQPKSVFTDLWETICSNEIWKGEICNKRKDGSFYWEESTIIPFTNKNDTIEKYVALRFDITKNKENALKLSKKNNKLSYVFNNANDALYITDADTNKIINVNKKAIQLLGYTKSEFIGMSITGLNSENNSQIIKNQINNLSTKDEIIFETQQKQKNGNVIDVEISRKLFNDGSQKVFLNIVRDISLRKQKEVKLKKSELTKNLIIENAPFCMHTLDCAGVMQSINPIGLKMLKLKKEDVIGEYYIKFFPNKDRFRIGELITKALNGAGSKFEITTGEGLVWATKLIPVANNEEIKVLGITEDITEERNKELIKERKIKNSEEKFKLIFDSAPDAYFIYDSEGRVVKCNLAALEMSGYTKSEILNKNIVESKLLSKASRKLVHQMIEFPSKESNKFELQVSSKQGKKIDVEFTSHLVTIDDENLVLNIARDITAHRIVQKKLQEKTNDLELFLYRSSHDLRAPYTSLDGLINLIKNEPLTNNAQELIGLFEQTLNTGKVLIDNLAIASEILNKPINIENIDLNKLINQVMTSLQSLNGFEDTRFNINIPKTFKLYSNAQLLIPILKTLIQNAISYKRPYTKGHTPFIIINALKTKEGIKISIKDNGMGIKKEEIDKVFDLYYRSNNSVDGTGLGLYITKNAVEKLNGTISAKSAINKETQFDILLPNSLTYIKNEKS